MARLLNLSADVRRGCLSLVEQPKWSADKKEWELPYDQIKNWPYDLLLVVSIPDSCVQSFKQHEVAGHVSDAFPVVGVPIEVAELATPAGVVAELSEVAGQDVEFPDDGIMDFRTPFVDRPFFFRCHHLPLHPSLCF